MSADSPIRKKCSAFGVQRADGITTKRDSGGARGSSPDQKIFAAADRSCGGRAAHGRPDRVGHRAGGQDSAGIRPMRTIPRRSHGAFGKRSLRGGSWNNNNPSNARAPNRNRNSPMNRNNNVGFRCAKTVEPGFPPGRPEPCRLTSDCAGATHHSPPGSSGPALRGPNSAGSRESAPCYAEPPLRTDSGAHVAGGQGLWENVHRVISRSIKLRV